MTPVAPSAGYAMLPDLEHRRRTIILNFCTAENVEGKQSGSQLTPSSRKKEAMEGVDTTGSLRLSATERGERP